MDINNLCNFFFVGIVTDVNPAEGTVIVTRPDKNDRTTAALKVIQRGTCKTRYCAWFCPMFPVKGLGKGMCWERFIVMLIKL